MFEPPPPPSEKIITLFSIGVSLYWERNSAQYALDCMRKPLEINNFPGGGPLDPFTVKYLFFQILTPPH